MIAMDNEPLRLVKDVNFGAQIRLISTHSSSYAFHIRPSALLPIRSQGRYVHGTIQTLRNANRHMPRVGFEPMISVFGRAKAFHAARPL
jgi:hypothetical protein